MTTFRSFHFITLAMLVTFSATASGCYKNVAIRPDQIPLLSDMPAPTVVGQSGNATVYAVATATVLTPEGTNVQIYTGYDLILRLNAGQELTFENPVRSTLDAGGVLELNGGNRPATRLNLGDVREAFVTQGDGVMTVLAMLLFSFVIPLAVTGVVLAIVL